MSNISTCLTLKYMFEEVMLDCCRVCQQFWKDFKYFKCIYLGTV